MAGLVSGEILSPGRPEQRGPGRRLQQWFRRKEVMAPVETWTMAMPQTSKRGSICLVPGLEVGEKKRSRIMPMTLPWLTE